MHCDFVQEQEYFKSLLEKIEQSLIVVERDKRCGVHVMLAALQLYIRTTQWLMQCTVVDRYMHANVCEH